jgi:hypothetical protein
METQWAETWFTWFTQVRALCPVVQDVVQARLAHLAGYRSVTIR